MDANRALGSAHLTVCVCSSASGSVSELAGVCGRVRAAHQDGTRVPEGAVGDRRPSAQKVSLVICLVGVTGPEGLQGGSAGGFGPAADPGVVQNSAPASPDLLTVSFQARTHV